MTTPALCIHGHFYQPPRENPWTGLIDTQPSAAPAHDWNARITDECYRPNAEARIAAADGLPERRFNNYSRISFDFGPTLLAYLAREQPDFYRRLLGADADSRRRFGGHGGAMAQSYSHAILPLASDRDRVTEVRWGLRDFELRFGRAAEGIWLPEAAVDIATLEVLAAQGLRFTLLAPHQAARVRPIRVVHHADEEWAETGSGGAAVDTHQPYRLTLPSGRTIAIFFYDGGLAHAVAFGDALKDGAAFLAMLQAAAAGSATSFVHLATDGESYGHHQAFSEMALAWVLDAVERGRSELFLTVYAEQLDRCPPTMEVEIHENTSWSCAHGIERWRSNCGCRGGRHDSGDQSWRGPLRASLDLLRDRLADVFEQDGAALLRDPWLAREQFVDVLVERSARRENDFLATHTRRWLSVSERNRAIALLDMQRHALLMYASCAWFFDDLADIEPRQALAHAAYAIELAGPRWKETVEREFLASLATAVSRNGETGAALLAAERAERQKLAQTARGLASASISG